MCHLHLNLQGQQAFVFFSRRNLTILVTHCIHLQSLCSSPFLRAHYFFLWLSFLKQVIKSLALGLLCNISFCFVSLNTFSSALPCDLYRWSRLMAFATFDGDGWYGFSIIFLFVGLQLFEDVLGIKEICLELHFYLIYDIPFLPPRSMTLENVHYKWSCFHDESIFFFW